MRIVRTIISFILLALCYTPDAFAQIVYQCDFEDAAERAQWELNEGPMAHKCPNKWYLGAEGNITRDGSYGLFVSDTTDQTTADYSVVATMYSVAVRHLTLAEGEYNIFFDWLAKGRAASGEGIWVCWVPESVDTYTARTLRPAWVDTYRVDSIFNSSSIWKQGKLTFSSDGTPHKLAIVWTNSNGYSSMPPSGCVDNITIIPKEDACPPPYEFSRTMNGTTMLVSWKGDADWYDARVYDYAAGTWQYFDSTTLKRISIDGLSEGMAQVYVRSHCGKTGVSEYVLYTPFYFLPGQCINYLAIDDKTQCTTYIGTASQPRGTPALVDSGYAAIESRHTLHYIPGETDPRTDNQLPTKPEGALASVRLGNWKTGAEGECIEYTYNVPDGDVAILKLRYAVVLNQPVPSHDKDQQSSFELHIYYTEPGKPNNLKPLPGGCGDAIFHVGYGDQTGWHAVGNGEVMWKEWTEVSVNLRDYVGKRILVRLSTADCTQGGHYSYAYYTLDCESAELSGLNCGADNPTTTFTAPDGFNYEWYLPSDPSTILSTEQTFTISPMDTLTYNVDVISKTNGQCYYTLDACGVPRYPVAKATSKWNGGAHCENAVTFYNKSYIYYKNIERWNQDQRTDTVYTNYEKVEHTTWDFGDGEVVESNADSITHVYPVTGGSFTPKITVSISNGACEVTEPLDRLDLPDIKTDEQYVHLGKGSLYKGKYYYEPCAFDDITEVEGCEILTHVFIHETEFAVDTSFCEGGCFILGDTCYGETGVYKGKLKSIQWPNVDSIVTLTLHVEPSLIVLTDDTVSACADQPVLDIPVFVQQGKMDSVHIIFSPEAVAAGFDSVYAFGGREDIAIPVPDSVLPGGYAAVMQLGTPRCPAPDIDIWVEIKYASSVIDQKTGILALLNDSLNGGYTFDSYTWYRNGEPIPGADSYYILVGNGDIGQEYSVVLTRSSDGVTVASCPITYMRTMGTDDIYAMPAYVWPTVVTQGGTVHVKADSQWMMLDVFGRVIIQPTDAPQAIAPAQPGIYLMVFPNANCVTRIIVQ